eukprot:CAMPEP_0178523700 /NCGR_PEP_ID=MMETSP0696-20121128/29245_1 /TAXON_ID=265572 /ORGANISM="Extubocellulus spinifer, Strain CCMP396" /LENGTH=835 /DNA_ID=CAMNT_0020154977 /DNA_START=88 /DNA_END=2597 /DNA_ORIENTATION=+
MTARTSTIRLLLLLPATCLLVKITLLAYRHVFYQDWAYLWDDAKNFHSNPHMVRPAFTYANIRWAWYDGEILGVWEPISLMMKMMLHDALDFTTKETAPRLYRMLSTYWHAFNVVLAFFVGLVFIRSVNDYDYIRTRIEKEMGEEGKRVQQGQGITDGSGGGKRAKSTSSMTQRGGKGGRSSGNRDTAGGAAAPSTADMQQTCESLLYNLTQHEAYATLGLWLGTLTFFSVHPLQAQTIGWISCISYIFSCTFALCSFWGYIRHRNIMEIGGGNVPGPFTMLPSSITPSGGNSSRRKRVGKSNKSAASVVPTEDGHETFLSLVCYVGATFCKSPAVTLPLVFIIVDVFIYSYPLSVLLSPQHPDAGFDGKQHKDSVASTSSGVSIFAPKHVVAKFREEAFPKLWNLTLRAILSWLPFLFASFVVTVFIIKGNTKNLLDIQTPFEKVEKSVWALSWYAAKIIYPSHLVAAVEKMSFSFLDHWEVAASLVAVPWITLAVLAYSTSSAAGRVVACAYGSFVAILLPSLGLIQHGRLFLAADRYAYLPLLIFGPIVASVFGSLSSSSSPLPAVLPSGIRHLFVGGQIPSDVASAAGSVVKADVSVIATSDVHVRKKKREEDSTQTSGQVNTTKSKVMLPLLIIFLIAASSYCAVVVTPDTLVPWRNSLLLWKKNAEIFPETENAHVNLGAAYLSSGDPKKDDVDKALHHAKKALEMRPDSPKYKANLGILYARRAEWSEAIMVLETALDLHPMTRWSPLMHKVLGQCLEKQNQLALAKVHFEKAIALGEKAAVPELARINQKIKRNPEAVKENEEKIRRGSKTTMILDGQKVVSGNIAG